MNTVLPSSSTNERIIWRNSAIPAGSSPFDGSSRIRSSGSVRRLRATPSRWRIPSEYFFTAVPAAPARSTRSSVASMRPNASRPTKPAADLQVPPPREVRIEPRLLDDRPHAGERLADVPRHLPAPHLDRPRGDPGEAEHAADQGRLAGAVRAEPAEAATARHVDRHVVDRDGAPEALRHAREPDDRLGCAHASSSITASDSCGQASFAQSPKLRPVRTAQASSALRVDPEERPAPAEMPERGGRGERARPVRRLVPLELDPEPPVERAEAPELGEHAVEPGELDGNHLGMRLGGDELRREELAPECEHVGERRVHSGARIAFGVERDPERLDDRGAHVLGERHLRAPRHMLAEHAEPLVGVDPATPRLRDRRAPVEGKARGVREQVAHGRAGRPRGLVEVEHALPPPRRGRRAR